MQKEAWVMQKEKDSKYDDIRGRERDKRKMIALLCNEKLEEEIIHV